MKTIEPNSETPLRCTFCHADCENKCPASAMYSSYSDASDTCSIAPGQLIDVRCTRCFQNHGVKATCVCSAGAIAGAVPTSDANKPDYIKCFEQYGDTVGCRSGCPVTEDSVTVTKPFPEVDSEENKTIRQRQLIAFKNIIEQERIKNEVLAEKIIHKASERLKEESTEPIEAEARRIVTGDRQAAYSHPIEDFTRTAKIWSGILGVDVTPNQVAMCMVGVKLSRECHKHKRDNVVDSVGYLLCLDMVIEAQGK